MAWVALGSNVGLRTEALRRLRSALSADGRISIAAASPEVITRPLGELRQGEFLNQVLRLVAEPALSPRDWLARCQAAEAEAGRRPTYRWGPRRADADLLLLGARGETAWSDLELTVPHPAVGQRAFLDRLLAAAGYTGSRSAS